MPPYKQSEQQTRSHSGKHRPPPPRSDFSAKRNCRFRIKCFCTGLFHRSDKTIATPRQGLDIPRVLSIVPKHETDFCNGSIECVIEIDERVVGPDVIPQPLARDQLARMFQEKG